MLNVTLTFPQIYGERNLVPTVVKPPKSIMALHLQDVEIQVPDVSGQKGGVRMSIWLFSCTLSHTLQL